MNRATPTSHTHVTAPAAPSPPGASPDTATRTTATDTTATGTGRSPVPVGLASVVRDLDAVIDLGPGRIDDRHVERARGLRARIDERLAIGDALTVVAFVGGTGVGKSALLNRLAGEPVATEGVRRPTTGVPLAVSGRDGADVDALLAWLDIADRRVAGSLAEDLILVDLPDHDSVVESHRLTSERLRQRVDGLIVVLDPLKYARADLHDGPLAELHAHAEVTLVVFNRVDALTGGDRQAALADAHHKLRDGGLADVELLATSAATGEGIGRLEALVTDLATQRSAAVRRLVGDAALFGAAAAADSPPPSERELDPSRLVEPLLEATDGNRRVLDADTTYRAEARRATRSPLARAVRAPFSLAARTAHDLGILSPAPRAERRPDVGPRVEGVLARELDLMEVTGAAHHAVDTTIARTAAAAGPPLVDAIRRVAVQPSPRTWWAALAWARGIAEAAVVAGLAWLVAIGVLAWLQLPPLPTPAVNDDLSWPAALFVFGLVTRVLLGILSRLAVRRGAARHGRAVGERLRSALEEVIEARITVPYQEETRRRLELHHALERLAAHTGPRGTASGSP